MKWFVAVSGNIGSGKSTVTTLLCEKLGWKQITAAPRSIIQDRTIYEDADIFARNLYLLELMDERDFRNYHELLTPMMQFLRPPDLIIYLRASVPTLLDRIRRRGRDYERGISAPSLAQLNERYEEWTSRFSLSPILAVDADDLDLANMDRLVAEMQLALPSLFPLIER